MKGSSGSVSLRRFWAFSVCLGVLRSAGLGTPKREAAPYRSSQYHFRKRRQHSTSANAASRRVPAVPDRGGGNGLPGRTRVSDQSHSWLRPHARSTARPAFGAETGGHRLSSAPYTAPRRCPAATLNPSSDHFRKSSQAACNPPPHRAVPKARPNDKRRAAESKTRQTRPPHCVP